MSDPRGDDLSWSLIARAAAGDDAARSAFGHCYLPVVRAFVASRWRGTSLATDVEDAVQEVFVECLRDGGVLGRADPERGDLRGLLFGVTRKVAARFEKRLCAQRHRAAASAAALDAIHARESTLSTLFDREWARLLIRLAGEDMRARAAEATDHARARVELLSLRFAEGLPIRAIAARWGTDPVAVHRAYAKAREEFRACLRRIVAEHAVRAEAELDVEVERIIGLIRRG